MSEFVPDPPEMKQLFDTTRTIAVVGLSDNPSRPSNDVARYLGQAGYTIVPVNPTLTEIWGLKAYPSLAAAKAAGISIDMVDVFRDPAHVVPIAKEAVEVGAKSIFFQLGVINEEAARVAKEGGLIVVMDRCAKIEHRKLLR